MVQRGTSAKTDFSISDSHGQCKISLERTRKGSNIRRSKQAMIDWLNEKGLTFDQNLTRLMLYDIIKQNKEHMDKMYAVDTMKEQALLPHRAQSTYRYLMYALLVCYG